MVFAVICTGDQSSRSCGVGVVDSVLDDVGRPCRAGPGRVGGGRWRRTSSAARQVGVLRPAVIKWRDRFATFGIDGLADEPRSGRPKTVDDAAILAATLEPPPESLAVTHWSSRLLGVGGKLERLTPPRLDSVAPPCPGHRGVPDTEVLTRKSRIRGCEVGPAGGLRRCHGYRRRVFRPPYWPTAWDYRARP